MKASITVEVQPVIDVEPRCSGVRRDGSRCRRKLAMLVARPWHIQCPRCGYENERPVDERLERQLGHLC